MHHSCIRGLTSQALQQQEQGWWSEPEHGKYKRPFLLTLPQAQIHGQACSFSTITLLGHE